MCENKKPLKSHKTKMRYKDCGLDNVILHGVEQFKCNRCGEVYFNFGDLEKLHALIAEILILKKGLITGKEVRFLRTYLGYSGAIFAKLMGCTKETLSRVENSKQKPGMIYDRLIRTLVYQKLPDRNYDLHDLWLSDKEIPLKNIELKPRGKGWQKIAA